MRSVIVNFEKLKDEKFRNKALRGEDRKLNLTIIEINAFFSMEKPISRQNLQKYLGKYDLPASYVEKFFQKWERELLLLRKSGKYVVNEKSSLFRKLKRLSKKKFTS